VQSMLEAELTVGQGPCTDVCRNDSAVTEPYLDSLAFSRWPIYAPLAKSEHAGAVFGFPVRIGAVRLGALFGYSKHSGELSHEQSSDGHLMASIIAKAILAMQAGAFPGELARELEQSATFDPLVQQAAGMLSEQGVMTIGDALVSLRAHSYAMNVNASVLARRIVDREISYDIGTHSWSDDQ